MKFDELKDEIVSLLDTGVTHSHIHQIIEGKYGKQRGLSLESLRRFIQTENLNPIIKNDVLYKAVESAINEVKFLNNNYPNPK